MTEDLDDTIIVGRRPGAAGVSGVDLDDTIVRVPRPMSPTERTTVTPPAPPRTVANTFAFRIGPHGESLSLEVPALIGRRPSAPRIALEQAPRLVTVPSELREVSSTHLEIRQRGDSVIVTDLGSTNGSIVTVPGRAPHLLRQGESMVVSPGTVIDIGDDNIVQILPIQSPASPAGRQS